MDISFNATDERPCYIGIVDTWVRYYYKYKSTSTARKIAKVYLVAYLLLSLEKSQIIDWCILTVGAGEKAAHEAIVAARMADFMVDIVVIVEVGGASLRFGFLEPLCVRSLASSSSNRGLVTIIV